MVRTIPDLVRRELVVVLLLLAFVFIFCILFDAPLRDKANPAFSPDPAKSPWYFLGIQELILHFHPLTGAFLIPFLVLAGAFYLPFFKFLKTEWLDITDIKRKLKLGYLSGGSGLFLTLLGIFTDDFVLDKYNIFGDFPSWIADGLIPLIILIILIGLIYLLFRRKFKINKTELVYCAFIFITVSYLTLMIIGIWFRGPGMSFFWPWQIN